jgi:hypothetical protein
LDSIPTAVCPVWIYSENTTNIYLNELKTTLIFEKNNAEIAKIKMKKNV